MAYTLTSAKSFEVPRLTDLLNRVYADYFFPVQMTSGQFVQMCTEEDISLEHSVVVLEDKVPVGLALFALRGVRGWISGVGILPAWRRRGLARRMIQHLQEMSHRLGLSSLTLEVLSQNQAGLQLYRGLGFEHRRDLLVLILERGRLAPQPLPAAISPISPASMLDLCSAWYEFPRPWQLEPQTLRHRLPHTLGFGYRLDGEWAGCVFYRAQAQNQAIYDLVVAPHPQRVQIARDLLLAVHSTRPRAGGYFINYPADAPLLEVFLKLHYHIWQRQSELVWEPSPKL